MAISAKKKGWSSPTLCRPGTGWAQSLPMMNHGTSASLGKSQGNSEAGRWVQKLSQYLHKLLAVVLHSTDPTGQWRRGDVSSLSHVTTIMSPVLPLSMEYIPLFSSFQPHRHIFVRQGQGGSWISSSERLVCPLMHHHNYYPVSNTHCVLHWVKDFACIVLCKPHYRV